MADNGCVRAESPSHSRQLPKNAAYRLREGSLTLIRPIAAIDPHAGGINPHAAGIRRHLASAFGLCKPQPSHAAMSLFHRGKTTDSYVEIEPKIEELVLKLFALLQSRIAGPP